MAPGAGRINLVTSKRHPLMTHRRYASQDSGLYPPPADPLKLFEHWLRDAAARSDIREPNAMHLATVDGAGRPHGRLVLLRGLHASGDASPIKAKYPAFVFHTNYESAKARQLAACSWAALTFWWEPLARQARVEGRVVKLRAADSDAYFATRPLGHRLSAWASPQSRILRRPQELEERVLRVKEQFADNDAPRPSYWGGYALAARSLEFWQGRPDRLHQRLRYRSRGEAWRVDYLAP